ncbi:MAG: cytidine deaminase [Pirellulales bacterium]
MSLTAAEQDELVAAALEAQKRAYAPYSSFFVGAAIRTRDGRIFTGANVENASYGLTICAERTAAVGAVTDQAGRALVRTIDGHTSSDWDAVAVASRGGVSPCGACRQFMMEFAPHMEVFLVDDQTGKVGRFATLAELLPGYFELLPSRI